MEQPRREKLTQGVLALLLACAVVATAVLERRSPVAQAIGTGGIWSARLSLGGHSETSPERSYSAVYDPRQRLLHLVYLPRNGPEAELPGFRSRAAETTAEEEPAQLAKDWLLGLRRVSGGVPQPLGNSVGLPGLRRPPEGSWQGLSRFDQLLVFLELWSLNAASIRPAWLSEDATAQTREGRSIAVEVLNGSGKTGLASQAKKILRLRGVDVVATGNLDARQARTIVYDRTGRYEDAEAVRRMLGCPSAAAVTRIDPKRLVDASVLLADDCPLP